MTFVSKINVLVNERTVIVESLSLRDIQIDDARRTLAYLSPAD